MKYAYRQDQIVRNDGIIKCPARVAGFAPSEADGSDYAAEAWDEIVSARAEDDVVDEELAKET